MKKLYFALILGVLTSCAITEDGIVIDTPNVPSVSLYPNVATDADAASMAEKIEAQTFPDERLSRARLVTKDYCFKSYQVITVIDAFVFDDNRLTMAKELYHQTTDKANYQDVVDTFIHKSDRDELIDYISQNP